MPAGAVRSVAAACIVLAAAACGGSDRGDTTPQSSFAYDPTRPLRFQDRGPTGGGPIEVRDVSFASQGRPVSAYLVAPPTGERLPAVVYLHGAGGDRGQLLEPAGRIAARGAIALALSAPSVSVGQPPDLAPLDALRRQAELAERDVVAVRRAVDLLAQLPRVDADRIGFVGWSAGARTGALLAGVERRIDAFVLMSGGAAPVSEYAAQAPAELRADVERILRQVDPLRFIGLARPGALLLQAGRNDEVVPQRALAALADAAPTGTSLRWYEAGHALDEQADRDQLAWLARKLGID